MNLKAFSFFTSPKGGIGNFLHPTDNTSTQAKFAR